MAIQLDGHTITQLVLNASNGNTITKQLVEVGGINADKWCIYNNELVDTWSRTVNLHSDTNFDSLTPSTIAQSVTLNNPQTKSFSVDFSTYNYLLIRESYMDIAYTETPSSGAMYDSSRILAIWLYSNRETASPRFNTIGSATTIVHREYNSSGQHYPQPNATAYGIYYGSGNLISYASTGEAQTTASLTDTIYTMRGSESHGTSLELVDSANSNIYERYSLYRIPSTTLFQTMTDEAKYISENGGLRVLE